MEEVDFQRESEMIKLAYKENMSKFNQAGYKGVVKRQMFDKIVQEYLTQKMDLARRRVKYWRDKNAQNQNQEEEN